VPLKRQKHPMTGDIGTLRVTRARLETTKQKRLNQMLDELE
jgi:hypothetical protein